MLRGSDITQAMLSELYSKVRAEQIHKVWENFILLEGEGIAFEITNMSSLWELGPFGHVFLSASTLNDAISLLQRFGAVAMPLCQFSREETKDTVTLCMAPRTIMSASVRRFHIEGSTNLLVNGIFHASDYAVCPISIDLEVQDQALISIYQERFHCRNIRAKSHLNVTKLVFARSACEKQWSFSDPLVVDSASSLCDSLLRRLESATPSTDKIREILSSDTHAFPDIKQLALNLSMSERTLRRSLASEGTSFQCLLQSEKPRIAVDLLQRKDLNVQSIADACGFKELPSFSAAFKRWTGMTPSDFRLNNRP